MTQPGDQANSVLWVLYWTFLPFNCNAFRGDFTERALLKVCPIFSYRAAANMDRLLRSSPATNRYPLFSHLCAIISYPGTDFVVHGWTRLDQPISSGYPDGRSRCSSIGCPVWVRMLGGQVRMRNCNLETPGFAVVISQTNWQKQSCPTVASGSKGHQRCRCYDIWNGTTMTVPSQPISKANRNKKNRSRIVSTSKTTRPKSGVFDPKWARNRSWFANCSVGMQCTVCVAF